MLFGVWRLGLLLFLLCKTWPMVLDREPVKYPQGIGLAARLGT